MSDSIDLSTHYLGLPLKNPLVSSASPLCEHLDNLKLMEDCGASAVVLHSLFEEQIRQDSEHLDHFLSKDADSFAESLTYFPDLSTYNMGPEACTPLSMC
jgi:dihydroorotate dehydrogenase (fumarate)